MRALSLLIKPASGGCNMRCRYCFYADVAASREVKNYGVMSTDTLEVIVRRALSEADGRCFFGFQGGEPTLAGLNFFRAFIELEKKYNTRNLRVGHSLQTNGLLIDGEWAAFLAENRFLVGLSVDGGKQVHDGLRPDAAGKGTHNRCLAAARRMSKAGVEFNILTVVTRQLAAHPDKAYRFYRQQGFRYLQFIPCLDGLDGGPGSHSLTAEQYGKFLCRVFDLWYADLEKGEYLSIRAFDNYIRMLAGQPPENCAMLGVCNAYPVVEADGSVYPCDFYCTDPYYLGNIADHSFEELLTGEAAQRFMAPSRETDGECRACEYCHICRGGCRRDREPLIGGMPSSNRFCESFRAFFGHCLPRMELVARRFAP